MAHFHVPAERRDDLAAERDDAADRRDRDAADRDTAAGRRDVSADGRDDRARRSAYGLDDLAVEVHRQILERFARIEDAAVEPAGWSHLPPAALAELRAHAAEQRRLAALDREAVDGLLTRLRAEIHRERADRAAAAADRLAAARDRVAAGHDRDGSVGDRDRAADDRDQAAVERAQADPPDREPPEGTGPTGESLADRVARAVAGSRQRIADSRAYLTRDRTDPLTAPPDAPRRDGTHG